MLGDFDASNPDTWILDFGRDLTADEVAYYAPMAAQAQASADYQASAGVQQGAYSPWDFSVEPVQSPEPVYTPGAITAGPSGGGGGAVLSPRADAPMTVSQSRTGTTMQYTNPNPNIIPITDATQLATIKSTYLQYVPANIPNFVNLMIQYGVSIYDVANATGRDPAFIAAQLGQPDGFGGYSKKNAATSAAGSTVNTPVTSSGSSSSISPVVLGIAAVAAYLAFAG